MANLNINRACMWPLRCGPSPFYTVVLSFSHFRFTLPKVVEDPNPHDLEYPDIPSIPEENEEDSSSSSRESPINFEEFSPDIDYPAVRPWKGILKKTASVS